MRASPSDAFAIGVSLLAVAAATALLSHASPHSAAALRQLYTANRNPDLSLQFSTYLGGGSFDRGAAIAADGDGTVYAAVHSQSRDFGEAQALPPDQAWLPATRTFVTKIDRDGLVAHWLFDDATARDLDVDASGNVYLAGNTASVPGRSGDAFLAKLDRSGRTLFRVMFGGSGSDFATGIAIDSAGNIVVAGGTSSPDFPLVAPSQPCTRLEPSGGQDAFVVKFDPNGTLLRSTCLGGSDLEFAADVAVDTAGDVHVVGWTRSRDFPTSPGVFQRTSGGGTCAPPSGRPCGDLFLVKLDGARLQTVFASFFGGNREDTPGGVATDGAGNSYVSGWTSSRNLPLARPLQSECRPSFSETDCGDGFVAKIAATGASLVYSTYLGGSRFDSAVDVAATSEGILYVAGNTGSRDFLARRLDTPSPTTIRHGDAFILQLDATGFPLELALFGGGDGDAVAALAIGERGTVYVTGETRSGDFPVIGGLQKNLRGEVDAFVAEMGISRLPWPRRLP